MNEDGTGAGRSPAGDPLLDLIREHHDSIRAALGEEGYALLLERLAVLAAVAEGDDRGRRHAMQGVRRALRPLPFDHRVSVALESWRLTAAPPEPVDVSAARELLAWLSAPAFEPEPEPEAEAEAEAGPEAGPEAEPALPETGTRPGHLLLGVGTFSAQETRDRCGGPPPVELIRVTAPREGDRYPRFQFVDGVGAPRQVVLEVNRLLLADIDPWGAGTWWLSENSWLGGTPADLLGLLPDHRLVGAATQLVEGE
ncbi:hypothetical protein ACI1MP_09445 [Kitasatospora griseola]|uniref:hypothetical protein n=1 Tax=Kitasatospora griseola TaxID=2064 RepID=UPI003855EE18